jgi:hypothetical protein
MDSFINVWKVKAFSVPFNSIKDYSACLFPLQEIPESSYFISLYSRTEVNIAPTWLPYF